MDQQKLPIGKSGYGRRPIWQWLLMYVVVGGAIYAGVYAFMGKHAQGYGYTSKAATQAPATTTSANQIQPAPAATTTSTNTSPAQAAPAATTPAPAPAQPAASSMGGGQW